MKKLLSLAVTAAICVCLNACGEGDSASAVTDMAKDAAGKLDLKPDELLKNVTSALNGITDESGAKSAVAKIGPMLEQLTKLKSTMADKMPDMSSLTEAVNKLKTKFAGNEGILNTLKPILDKITNLAK